MTRRVAEALATGFGAACLAAAAFRRGPLRLVAPVLAGAAGVVSGRRGIYRWASPRGWVAFGLDATWNLAGTTAGLAMHALQWALGTSGTYRADLSERADLHVYEAGPSFHPDFALTWGTVVSNAGGRVGLDPATPAGRRRRRFVVAHEALHVWQQRWLGPLYPIVYGGWVLGGAAVATVLWWRRGGSWRRTVTTLAYYDNPFEYWAYRRDDHWPPRGADPALAWGGGGRHPAVARAGEGPLLG